MSLLDTGTGLLRTLPPELSHRLGLQALGLVHALGLLPLLAARRAAGPAVRVMGIDFPSRVGIAAGIDKEARYLRALAALGPGFVELGTVTPGPCAGSGGPRLWRLPRHGALVNRLGFPNPGVEAVRERLGRLPGGARVGVSLGKHPDTALGSALADIRACMERLQDRAHYFAVNISSPNSPGLRRLEDPAALGGFLVQLRDIRAACADAHGRSVPLAVKFSADIEDAWIPEIADRLAETGVDGAILCNTTLERPGGCGAGLREGGLSGAPLAERSRELLGLFRARWRRGEGPALISCGGVMDGAEAAARVSLGADLVQLYTGLVYAGPGLIAEAASAMAGLTPGET